MCVRASENDPLGEGNFFLHSVNVRRVIATVRTSEQNNKKFIRISQMMKLLFFCTN